MQTTGWLFDLYPLSDLLVLWFITEAGEHLRLEDDFPYCIYLGGPPARLDAIARTLKSQGWVRRGWPARGRDLWTGEEVEVLALEVRGYGLLRRLRNWLGALSAGVDCYNCDLDVATYYLYSRRLFPCAWYHLEAQGGRLVRLEPLEAAFALEVSPPPLTTLTLSLTRDPLIPLDAGNGLVIGWDGETLELAAPDIPGLLADLARCLKRADPDLVLSDWGDDEIIPTLTRWSREAGAPLPLDRETGPVDRKFGGSRSYFSYGQIIYQGAAAPFYGRWHLDRRNSFYYREAGLPGLMQISRIGQMPLQRAARASPGTLITSMQLARATADGILIPWRKGEPERFKTAGELLTIDKGGLTFMPPIGLHFEVAEVDFASMYPTIMAIHNISPETVNCACCAGALASSQLPVASGFSNTGHWPRSPGYFLALNQGEHVEPPPSAVPSPARAPARPYHIDVEAEPVGAQLAVPSPAERVYVEQPPSAVLGATPRVAPTPRRGACATWPPMPAARRGGSRTAPRRSPAFTDPVPEAGYHLCRRREGLVPRTLKPILQLREALKARAKEVTPEEALPYKERQNALKWMLVTCFGYLGYKNARFGRIEAHEAVTAHGRDKLLTAKEICEAAGFKVLHGLTDCLWLQKDRGADTGLRENDLSFGGPGVSPVWRKKPVAENPLSPSRGEGWGEGWRRRLAAPPSPCPLPPSGGVGKSLRTPIVIYLGRFGWLSCELHSHNFAGNSCPAPLVQRGVQSPPLEKGDLGGFKISTAKPEAIVDLLDCHDLPATTKKENVEPPPSAVPAPALHWHIKAKRYEAELEELCQKISAATGVKLALEGVYRWLCFMPSKQDPKRPVATRYFGVFADGSLKVRGLALRRRDTPPFVRRAQEALLAKLTEAVTPVELLALKPELEEMAEGFRRRLREGRIKPQDLVITRVLSQSLADYKVDTPTALAARQLEAAGIRLQPGEKVRYVHAEKKGGPKECRIQAAPFLDTLDDYDVGHYLELLERAIEEVLLPFGEL